MSLLDACLWHGIPALSSFLVFTTHLRRSIDSRIYTPAFGEADLQSWLTSHRVNLDQWNKAYESFTVTMKTQQAMQTWQNYQLDATPYVAVNGKYLTAPHMAGSRQKTIEVLNTLIEQERQIRQKH